MSSSVWQAMSVDGVLEDTGMEEEVLDYIFNKYADRIFEHTGPDDMPSYSNDFTLRHVYFYLVFVYMHTHPKTRQFKRTMWVRGMKNGYHSSHFYRYIVPVAMKLSEVIDELKWGDRLAFDNHCPAFPFYVTGITDTMPLRVSQPVHQSNLERGLYAVKYATHVVKLALTCTFKREIIHMSGIHMGAESDGAIGERTIDSLPLFPWERWLADGPYESSRFCIVPYRTLRIPGPSNVFRPLTAIQILILHNRFFSFYRSRIEQVNATVRNHDIIEGRPFRGNLAHLDAYVKIIVHCTNVGIRQGKSRLDGYGWWPHAMSFEGP